MAKSCRIDFEVNLKSINGTIDKIVGTGYFILQSECYHLGKVYDQKTSNSPFWVWDAV